MLFFWTPSTIVKTLSDSGHLFPALVEAGDKILDTDKRANGYLEEPYLIRDLALFYRV